MTHHRLKATCTTVHLGGFSCNLPPALIINSGDSIAVELGCVPNAKNPRDLDIDIEYHLENAEGTWHSTQEYKLR